MPRPERLKRSPADSCIDCHMPRTANQRIAHTATSNHQIPRRPEAIPRAGQEEDKGGTGGPKDQSFLVSFFQELREQDRASGREPETDQGRDLGVALSVEPPDPSSPGTKSDDFTRANQLALSLLDRSLARVPDDPEVWAARGRVLERLGRAPDSLASFQSALELKPGKETLLLDVASRALQDGDLARALPLLERLIRLNPWRADYFNLLATAHTNTRNWTAAADACRSSLALNAFDVETRVMLVQALVQAADGRAEAEFETLLKCNPGDAGKLRAWFARSRRR